MALSAKARKLRLFKLTGSTTAPALGESHYSTPYDAWLEITGQTTFKGNKLTWWGEKMEPICMERVALDMGLASYVKGTTMLHPDHPQWWAATPDYLVPAINEGVQIKCSGAHMRRDYVGRPGEKGRWDNDLIPVYHLIQCHWEMAVMGWEVWHLAVFFDIHSFYVYHIKRDPELLELLTEEAFDWWRMYVNPDAEHPTQPPVTFTPRPSIVKRKLSDDQVLAAPLPEFE